MASLPVTKLQRWTRAVYWFCLIFLAVGSIVIALGIWTQLQNVMADLVSVIPLSFIVIGSFVFVVSFMGWYSAKRQSKRQLLIYNIMLVLSCLTIVGLSIGTYVADLQEIDEKLYAAWSAEYESPNGESSSLLFSIEQEFSCCGFYNDTHMEVPAGSCLSLIRDAADGCFDQLSTAMTQILELIFGISLGAGIVQALGLVFGVLAYKEAPSQSELDSLLSEEAKRLNETWTVAPSGSTSVQRT